MNFVPNKYCLTDLAFGFMPLERMDESFLRHFWIPASLLYWPSGGGSQNIDSHVGRGSVYHDDGPVAARARARGSTRKRKRGGGAVERGPGI